MLELLSKRFLILLHGLFILVTVIRVKASEEAFCQAQEGLSLLSSSAKAVHLKTLLPLCPQYTCSCCDTRRQLTSPSPLQRSLLALRLSGAVDAGQFSPSCRDALQSMACRPCDPEVGVGRKPALCGGYCKRLYDACRSDFFVVDERSGRLLPCAESAREGGLGGGGGGRAEAGGEGGGKGGNGGSIISTTGPLICARLDTILSDGQAMCQGLVGESTVVTSDDRDSPLSPVCFDGMLTASPTAYWTKRTEFCVLDDSIRAAARGAGEGTGGAAKKNANKKKGFFSSLFGSGKREEEEEEEGEGEGEEEVGGGEAERGKGEGREAEREDEGEEENGKGGKRGKERERDEDGRQLSEEEEGDDVVDREGKTDSIGDKQRERKEDNNENSDHGKTSSPSSSSSKTKSKPKSKSKSKSSSSKPSSSPKRKSKKKLGSGKRNSKRSSSPNAPQSPLTPSLASSVTILTLILAAIGGYVYCGRQLSWLARRFAVRFLGFKGTLPGGGVTGYEGGRGGRGGGGTTRKVEIGKPSEAGTPGRKGRGLGRWGVGGEEEQDRGGEEGRDRERGKGSWFGKAYRLGGAKNEEGDRK